jgi:hypothetical protein
MRNNIQLRVVILGLAFVPATAMPATTINIKDLAADGVRLTPSTSPTFMTEVTALLGDPSPTAVALLPYSVIVRNLTDHIIRGYALRWTFIDQNGAADANYQIEQNFDTRRIDAEIMPGSGRILSPAGPLRSVAVRSSSSGQAIRPDTLAKLAGKVSITVSLDAVAFDNGRVIGPNEGFALNVWSTMYAAQKDVALEVLQRSRTFSAPELIDWLKTQATKAEDHPPGSSTQELLGGSSHWYQVYARMAASRLLQFSKLSNESMLAEARQLSQTPVPVLSR